MEMTETAQAWLVVAADGYRSVYLDQATAMRYAVRVHGLVYPLFHGRRRTDDKPETEGAK